MMPILKLNDARRGVNAIFIIKKMIKIDKCLFDQEGCFDLLSSKTRIQKHFAMLCLKVHR